MDFICLLIEGSGDSATLYRCPSFPIATPPPQNTVRCDSSKLGARESTVGLWLGRASPLPLWFSLQPSPWASWLKLTSVPGQPLLLHFYPSPECGSGLWAAEMLLLNAFFYTGSKFFLKCVSSQLWQLGETLSRPFSKKSAGLCLFAMERSNASILDLSDAHTHLGIHAPRVLLPFSGLHSQLVSKTEQYYQPHILHRVAAPNDLGKRALISNVQLNVLHN